VMAPFPAAANSGQYRDAGSSKESSPRSTMRPITAAAAPFVAEKTPVTASSFKSRPPARSTTVMPRQTAQICALYPGFSASMMSNASRTRSKPLSTVPARDRSEVSAAMFMIWAPLRYARCDPNR
jgi:hypothetical protein